MHQEARPDRRSSRRPPTTWPDGARLGGSRFTAGTGVVGGRRRGLGAVVDAEFGHDRAHVGVGGLVADAKGGGDLGVAVAGGKEFEYVALALRQSVWVGAG